MSRVGLCVDSSAQPFAVRTRAAGPLEVVPVHIVLNGADRAETELDPDAFYGLLERGVPATTSTPSPGEVAAAYERLAAAGAGEALSLHPDERVSGIVGAARLAAAAAPLPVRVVDTGQASFGVALCLLAADAALAAGGTCEEAAETARAAGATLRNVSAVGAAAGGRLGPRGAGVTLVELAAGMPRALGSAPDAAAALEAIAAVVLAAEEPVAVAVGHASAAAGAAADRLAARLAAAPAVASVHRYRVPLSVGVHTGAGAFGCFWWPDGTIPSPSGDGRTLGFS